MAVGVRRACASSRTESVWAAGRTTFSSSAGAEIHQALYALPAADFNDATTGTNGAFTASVGYDNVTGLGTPAAASLIPHLVGFTGAYQANATAADIVQGDVRPSGAGGSAILNAVLAGHAAKPTQANRIAASIPPLPMSVAAGRTTVADSPRIESAPISRQASSAVFALIDAHESRFDRAARSDFDFYPAAIDLAMLMGEDGAIDSSRLEAPTRSDDSSDEFSIVDSSEVASIDGSTAHRRADLDAQASEDRVAESADFGETGAQGDPSTAQICREEPDREPSETICPPDCCCDKCRDLSSERKIE